MRCLHDGVESLANVCEEPFRSQIRGQGIGTMLDAHLITARVHAPHF